jgi:predicted transcriptional regulator
MQENYNNNGLAENKVLILYTLNTINRELTNNDLFKIISAINDINYFYFSDILIDLVNSKLIATYTKEEKQEIFKITSDGQNSLELTLDILPGIVKLKADNIFRNELNHIAEEKSITAEYIPENEKDYTVKCKIIENNKTVFEVRTFAGSNEQAKRIADNWKNNANIIYPQIMDLLNKS